MPVVRKLRQQLILVEMIVRPPRRDQSGERIALDIGLVEERPAAALLVNAPPLPVWADRNDLMGGPQDGDLVLALDCFAVSKALFDQVFGGECQVRVRIKQAPDGTFDPAGTLAHRKPPAGSGAMSGHLNVVAPAAAWRHR